MPPKSTGSHIDKMPSQEDAGVAPEAVAVTVPAAGAPAAGAVFQTLSDRVQGMLSASPASTEKTYDLNA